MTNEVKDMTYRELVDGIKGRWGFNRASACESELMARLASAVPAGPRLKKAVTSILANCAARYVNPESVHRLDPQSVIDKQIDNGVQILKEFFAPSPATGQPPQRISKFLSCPKCFHTEGFERDKVWETAIRWKCVECGEWSTREEWGLELLPEIICNWRQDGNPPFNCKLSANHPGDHSPAAVPAPESPQGILQKVTRPTVLDLDSSDPLTNAVKGALAQTAHHIGEPSEQLHTRLFPAKDNTTAAAVPAPESPLPQSSESEVMPTGTDKTTEQESHACRSGSDSAASLKISGLAEPVTAEEPEPPCVKCGCPEKHWIHIGEYHPPYHPFAAAQSESAAKVEEIAEQVVKVRYKLPMSASFNEVVAATIAILRPYIPSQPPANFAQKASLAITKMVDMWLEKMNLPTSNKEGKQLFTQTIQDIIEACAAPVTPVSQPPIVSPTQVLGCECEEPFPSPYKHCGTCGRVLSTAQMGLPQTGVMAQAVAPVSGNGPEPPDIETWAKKLYSDHYHVDMSDAEWGKLSSNTRQHWLDKAKRSIEFLYRRRRKDDIKPSAHPTPKGEK